MSQSFENELNLKKKKIQLLFYILHFVFPTEMFYGISENI